VAAPAARSITPTPGLSREVRGLGATQYKGTRTIKCNMLKKLKEGDAGPSSSSAGPAKKGVVALLALALVAAVGMAATSCGLQARVTARVA
jgi:hypothetical protein